MKFNSLGPQFTYFFLLRHGDTDNKRNLLPLAIEQAITLGEKLCSKLVNPGPRLVYCSPQPRAIVMAQTVQKEWTEGHPYQLTTVPEFDDISAEPPEVVSRLREKAGDGPTDVVLINDPEFLGIARRRGIGAAAKLHAISAANSGEIVLVGGHGGAFRCMMSIILNIKPSETPIWEKGEIHCLEINNDTGQARLMPMPM